MVSLRRLLKDHRQSGSVASLLALWGFVDDQTFLTKAGAVGVVFRLRGIDDECLDHEERRVITMRFEQALRHLDESFRVYQYLIKRPASPFPRVGHHHPIIDQVLQARAADLASRADALFELESYLVIVYEGWTASRLHGPRPIGLLPSPVRALATKFSVRQSVAEMEEQLQQAVRHLHQKAQAVVAQLADTVAPALLNKSAVFTFLRRLVNYAPHKIAPVSLAHDTHLDFYVSDSDDRVPS